METENENLVGNMLMSFTEMQNRSFDEVERMRTAAKYKNEKTNVH